jgi:hypothetical protein
MLPGIQDMPMTAAAEPKGLQYGEWLKKLKEKKRGRVEVY